MTQISLLQSSVSSHDEERTKARAATIGSARDAASRPSVWAIALKPPDQQLELSAAAEAAVAEALAAQARVRSVETRWRRRSGAWPPPPHRSPPHRLPPPPPSSPPPRAAAPASAAAPGRSPGAREGARPGLGRAGNEAEAGARAGTTTAAAATPGGDGVADAADPPAGGVGRAERRLVLRPAPGHLRERAPPLPVALSARPALHALHGPSFFHDYSSSLLSCGSCCFHCSEDGQLSTTQST